MDANPTQAHIGGARTRTGKESERGAVLVYMVVSLIILGLLGAAMAEIFSASLINTVIPNDARRAQYMAEAGLRYAISELKNSNNATLMSTLLRLNNSTYDLVPQGGHLDLSHR